MEVIVFISDKFKAFCKNINIKQAVLSSYHHQSNGQVEACIKFIKQTFTKCFDTESNPHIALFADQINAIRAKAANPCNTAV